MNLSLGTVIATRDLTWKSADGTCRAVSVFIGTPQWKGPIEVFVPFQIEGMDHEHVRFAAGVDGVQALVLALRMIRADLESLESRFDGRLVWLGHDEGCGGFA